jgi:hypothetical protein
MTTTGEDLTVVDAFANAVRNHELTPLRDQLL